MRPDDDDYINPWMVVSSLKPADTLSEAAINY